MKLDEVFDEDFYDFIQDDMKRKIYDPYKDEPVKDTEMHIGDYIVSAFKAGKMSYDEAADSLKDIADSPIDYQFWRIELAVASEEQD